MKKGLFIKYLTFLLCLGWTLTFGGGISLCQNLPPVFAPVPNCHVSKPDSEEFQLSGDVQDGDFLEHTILGTTFTTCKVAEEETLELYVHATDPEGDSVFLSVLNLPPSALFSDLGNGTAKLLWVPDYIGPWSSVGSPFVLFFVASDESLSSQLRVKIGVINVNRNPEMFLPDSSEVAAGSQLVFQVRSKDLDSEQVMVQALNLPSGAGFDPASGIFNWIPQLADTGLWTITFRATDQSGGECIKETKIMVLPPSTFNLGLGVVEALLGSVVNVPVNLVNSLPVAGMELSIEFDPLEFTFLGVSRQGCRIQNWEYFTYREKTVGQTRLIKIVGLADLPNQVAVLPLLPDSGTIVYLSFRVTTDPYLNGFLLPLEFLSYDISDNTLSTHRGRFIPQENIDLSSGGVLLNSAGTLIGDINLNGLAFEVGDAVKFAVYLSGMTKLSPQQMINSDVNQDGNMATLADFVFLINRIMTKGTMPREDEVESDEVATVKIADDSLETSIKLVSDTPVGGAMVIFKGKNLQIENITLSPQAQGLDLYTSRVGDELRVMVISPEAKPLPGGDSPLLNFEGKGFDTMFVSLSDHAGKLMGVKQQHEHNSLPTKYALYQNYPNPFNPETNIKYAVGGEVSVRVSLKIYNVVGQLVKTMVDEEEFPGEYTQIWNGQNENNEDVASGVYFYKLKVSNYVETKKMVLLR